MRLLLLALALALAAPDPMAAGNLERLVVETSAGDVDVRFAKTQHVRLDGEERDATRTEGLLEVRRAAKDVDVTVPIGTQVRIRTASGDVTVHGPARGVQIVTASGDVEVQDGRGDLRIETGSGDQALALILAAGAATTVVAKSGAGSIEVLLAEDTPVRIDAKTDTGRISGVELGAKAAKARLELESGSGDLRIRRPKGR